VPRNVDQGITLSREEVHVWWAVPEYRAHPELVAQHEGLLTREERNRLESFAVEWRRLEFLLTRTLVRTVLSKYTGVDPKVLRFRSGAYGRPELASPSWLQFNLSNSRGMVACGVSRRRIGIDLEPHDRDRDILQIARSSFAEPELQELGRISLSARPDRALSLWTLKEAYVKARGMGLAIPLDAFSILFGASGAPSLHLPCAMEDGGSGWDLRVLDRASHRLALAVERDGRSPPRLSVARTRPLAPAGGEHSAGAGGVPPDVLCLVAD
jgi:4'-phosphopantetheinyl transferase